MSDPELQKVEDFISDIQSVNPEFAEIIERVRDIFTEEDENLVSGIKYGGLAFFQNGELIGGVFQYKEHLSIEFSNGATFSDPFSKLQGKGKKRRHIKIITAEDIDRNNTMYFVKQAVRESSDND